MPFLDTHHVRLHYQIDGLEEGPWLILSNSLGTQLDMWAPQMPALRKRFRVLRYDTRGHGQSSVPPGPYTIAKLGDDVIALMDHLQIDRAHFCGLSMGGMIGMWLGANRAARINRLVLCNTAALIGPPELWNTRIAKVNSEGMGAIVPAVIDRWFTPEFQKSAHNEVDLVRKMLLHTHTVGYAANCAAVRDMDLRESLFAVRAPTLVIAGAYDAATPPQDSRLVADRIAHARYVSLEAAHLSNWEVADEFTDTLVGFLTEGA
ncbi:3-oxoadipate enol-lactonase [Noviherbaspirillum cavernae]|uniref:3-oxoadipate enol-lactonase n=1 Tax=Noviherbaspirillum cavernae TaxID=2320862 RepID=A0A418X2K6_9BURK|nr:3-oxoadipate enol-lactonase [Noviherbaspirillum cavernae]RJG06689.1 3-oxoadipate enol-lactonase [Noviherbaspirillum cavernae]